MSNALEAPNTTNHPLCKESESAAVDEGRPHAGGAVQPGLTDRAQAAAPSTARGASCS